MLAAALGRFLQVATLTAKLGWSEERGTVFSLNVALNLALVPSDAPRLSTHISWFTALDSWTSNSPLIPAPSASPPHPHTDTSARGQDTELEYRSHSLHPTEHLRPVWLPSVLSPKNWTGFVYTILGLSSGDPPPQSPSLCLWTCFLLLHLTHFSVVSLSCHPCRGWAEGPPELVPLTIPHALPGSLAWPSESPCLVSTPLPLCPLPLCLASCHLSVPKPFQSFQVTILGEKDCAAFSL